MTAQAGVERFAHRELSGGVHAAVLSTKKLKTVVVRVYFVSDLDDDVTPRALLPAVLKRGSRRLPDLQVISRALEDLYGAALSSAVWKAGEWHVVTFQLDVVNDAFIPGENGLLGRGLELLRGLIFDPLEVGGGFHPDYVEREIENQRLAIESLVDDKAIYALQRCTELMCSEEPFRRLEIGSLAELEGIDSQGLLRFHSAWTGGSRVCVYLAGDVDEAAAMVELERWFGLERQVPRDLRKLPQPVAVGAPRTVEERMDVSQGKLVLGFRHGITYADGAYEALLVTNGILGAFSRSKLFRAVREERSLAYAVGSAIERTKGLLFVSAGIAPESYAETVAISLREVAALRRGDVDREELDAAVETVVNQNLVMEDHPSALAEVEFLSRLHARDYDLPAFRERLRRVTRDDVVDVAGRLRHDMTYFLRP